MRSLTVLLILLSAPGLALAQAGRFLLAVGEVAVARGQAEIRAATGTLVQSGDTIRVGPASNAQIRMTDESIVGLRPGTVFRIDAYEYSGQAEPRSIFSLLKGGFRTVTGAIGRLHSRERYAVRTPTGSRARRARAAARATSRARPWRAPASTPRAVRARCRRRRNRAASSSPSRGPRAGSPPSSPPRPRSDSPGPGPRRPAVQTALPPSSRVKCSPGPGAEQARRSRHSTFRALRAAPQPGWGRSTNPAAASIPATAPSTRTGESGRAAPSRMSPARQAFRGARTTSSATSLRLKSSQRAPARS